jgi:hypothetical protein
MGSNVRRVKRDRVPGGESQIEWRLQMMYRIAFPLLALAVASGCSGRDATGPIPKGTTASAAASSSRGGDDDRSGALHATKECSQYTGQAGSFCTITSSNLKQIAVGSKVVYTKGVTGTTLDTDVTIYPPGEDKDDVAFGHVVLDLVTSRGVVTLSGGTGKFRRLRARADITHLSGRNWAWDGTYWFSKNDGD